MLLVFLLVHSLIKLFPFIYDLQLTVSIPLLSK